MTFQIAASQRLRKRRSNKSKPSCSARSSANNSNKNKQERYVPLLPKIMGIRAGGRGDHVEVLAKGGQIKVEDFWTTEALIDGLGSCITQVKEEERLLPLQSRSSSFCYSRKYLNHAIELIGNWPNTERTRRTRAIIFHLSDLLTIDGRIVAELIDLDRTAPSTISYVLHKVVERLFGLVSARWFYQSASEEIAVRLDP